jgi:hypothetical protein
MDTRKKNCRSWFVENDVEWNFYFKTDVKGVGLWAAVMLIMLTEVYVTAVIHFRRFRKFAKTTVGFVMSVRMEQLCFIWTDFNEILDI